MNIGTMGAATILMRNNTNMMRGAGGGGGPESEEKPKGLGKLLLVFTVLVIAAWCFHTKPDFWYVEVEQRIVAKQMLTEETSKGNTYQAGYIQVETDYVEENFQWVQKDSTLWIGCNSQNYLNYEIGQSIKQQIVKPHLQGWSTAMTWIVVCLAIAWTFILAAIMAINF